MKFSVRETSSGKFQITGTIGYRLVLDNRHDAEKHCRYLNNKEDFLDKYIEQNVEYFNTLTKIKMLVEQIQVESGELHVLELAIRIKKLIQEVI